MIVLEAEDRLAAHQTGHNSGVIHSGLYYRPGTEKAKGCVEGRQLLYRFCQEHGIAHERCGKVVVATEKRELPALEELERRGRANGLVGLRRLGAGEIREIEPHAAGISGLYVAETGIVDYKEVAEAFAKIFLDAGGMVQTSCRVQRVRLMGNELVLDTSSGEVACGYLINCCGLHSDRFARLCGMEPGLEIVPFRGEYHEMAPERRFLVRNLIYPVPDPRFPFLGVHFTRTIHGAIEVGPNAVLALKREGYRWRDFSLLDTLELAAYPGFWRMVGKYWKNGIRESYRSLNRRALVKALQRLVPEVNSRDLLPASAGVRAQALDHAGTLIDDFRIVEAERMIHVLNAPSPAATASIHIGRTIATLAEKRLGLWRSL
jgi:(S)-2-hydroxyglutarate dehydrogenase